MDNGSDDGLRERRFLWMSDVMIMTLWKGLLSGAFNIDQIVGFQIVRRANGDPDQRAADRCGGAERMRQIEYHRCGTLGAW